MASKHDSNNYLNVPGVNPDRLEGRQRYIPITCTLSPGYKRKSRRKPYNLLITIILGNFINYLINSITNV